MFPWKFRNDILLKNLSLENKEELALHYRDIFYKLGDAEFALITLREENKRLTAENNFMLKLINEHMDPSKT
jgi:hypothetical protein